jgi:2-dehydropantoate 2-reductase
MRIAVLGAGGMGGYFGGRLARAGEPVVFIARGEQLAAITARGLTVRSIHGDFSVPVTASDDARKLADRDGPADLVLFCVKSYDTEAGAEAIRPLVGPDTAVLTLQNGVVNLETLTGALGAAHVLGGLVYGFAVIEAPGVIRHTQGGRIILGELDGRPSPRSRAFVEAAGRAGFPAEVSGQIRAAMWEKYVVICALSGLTSVARRPIGEIRTCAESRRLYRTLVEELVALARAEGLDLGADMVERTMAAADALHTDSYSSLYHDLTHGRRLELEALQGHAVRLGERHGVPTPGLFAVYAALRPAALHAERARA